MFRVLITCAAMALPSLAQAQEYTVLGAGNQSCGSWVKKTTTRNFSLSWVLGFITAMNATEAIVTGKDPNVTEGTDANGVELWITNYCSANPLKTVSDATMRLYVALEK
ncbi:MAG: hypothetical protein EOQ43_26905 [Mesorhizobium sp.]|nr:MAG: hypothetical protein EOQ43_26905 [Mesorhizobium sp.]